MIVNLAWIVALVLTLLAAFLFSRRRENRLRSDASRAREQVEQLKAQLENVRHRTARLREDLSAADQHSS